MFLLLFLLLLFNEYNPSILTSLLGASDYPHEYQSINNMVNFQHI